MLLVTTIHPSSCSIMWGRTALVMEMVPIVFSSRTAWSTPKLVSMAAPLCERPALLTRKSIWKDVTNHDHEFSCLDNLFQINYRQNNQMHEWLYCYNNLLWDNFYPSLVMSSLKRTLPSCRRTSTAAFGWCLVSSRSNGSTTCASLFLSLESSAGNTNATNAVV